MVTPTSKSPYSVRSSAIHGRGVIATRLIRKGARIIEYRGTRSTMEAEYKKPPSDPRNPYHTFLFELSDGTAINGAIAGNAARWINHSCDPNCEAIEEDGRVFIYAKRTIRAGDELTYDYRLTLPGRLTSQARKALACNCGARICRGAMLQRPSSIKR